MLILKFALKLFAIPLAMILCTIHVLAKMMVSLASIPANLVMLALLLAGIQLVCHHEWSNVGMLFVVETVLVTIQVVILFLVDKIADWAAAITAFIFT